MRKKQSFFPDTKPETDKIKRKIVANSKKPLFSYNNTFLKVKTTKIF